MVGRKVNYRKLLGILKHNDNVDKIEITEFCQGRQVRWGIAWKIKKTE